jgi:hypothetical protein
MLFNKVGEMCQKAGLQFGYHNHDFEFVPVEGQAANGSAACLDEPRSGKDRADLYWAVKAKQDPVALG